MDPTVLCLPKDTPKVRNTGRNARHFFVSLSVCLYFVVEFVSVFLYLFVEFVCPGSHFGGHFGNFGCPDPYLDPKRAQGPENIRFQRFPARIPSPVWEALGAPFRHFFGGLRDTKKGVREGLQN